MTKQVQRRRGTATQHTSFTGAEGEVSVNTTNKSVHVHDGVTAGGIEGARADLTNVSDSDLNARLTGNTLSSLTITSADINGGTIDGTVIGGTTPAAGNFTTGSFTGNATFGDNDKAIFGAGSDLQIYHDGASSSYISTSTGNLIIQDTDGGTVFIRGKSGENSIIANDDGSVRLFFDNAEKLATTATGIDVTGTVIADSANITGTVTADGLTVGGEATFGTATGVFPDEAILVRGNNGTSGYINGLGVGSSNAQFRIFADDTNNTAGSIKFDIRNRDRILIEDSGDISFYEDTGTDAKFFWSASAERLVIGDNTVSPSGDAGDLVVGGSTGSNGITIGSATTGTGSLRFADTGGTGRGIVLYDHSSDFMNFQTAGSERMRLDASGNLLVGTTTTSVWDASAGNANDNGISLLDSGILGVSSYKATANSGFVSAMNRTGTDGNHIIFRKDGSTVGSIGTNGGKPFIVDSFGVGVSVNRYNGESSLMPAASSAATDAAGYLGGPSNRWKDLYLSGGVYLGRGSGGATLYTSRRVDSGAGGAIFATVVSGKAQMGELYAYDTATNNWCHYSLKKDDSTSNVTVQQISGTGLTINATNSGGTIAMSITASTVRMVVTIWVVEN